MSSELSVQRDDSGRRYVAMLAGRQVGAAYFDTAPDGAVVFTHTEIDEDEQGTGVGSELVRQALDDVRSRGLPFVARCSFVARFVRDHPEYQG